MIKIKSLKRLQSLGFMVLIFLIAMSIIGCDETDGESGCDGQPYPNPSSSPYVIPFPVGSIVNTGLTNCSTSFHSAGEPDQYAFDFDLPELTKFTASRAGTVLYVVETESSNGGGTGNYLLIDHGDDTYAYYLHSPKGGILVDKGEEVQQGDTLGVVGHSGQAGYSHLHFIVVKGGYYYPYSGAAISFKNAEPQDKVLQSYSQYKVLPY